MFCLRSPSKQKAVGEPGLFSCIPSRDREGADVSRINDRSLTGLSNFQFVFECRLDFPQAPRLAMPLTPWDQGKSLALRLLGVKGERTRRPADVTGQPDSVRRGLRRGVRFPWSSPRFARWATASVPAGTRSSSPPSRRGTLPSPVEFDRAVERRLPLSQRFQFGERLLQLPLELVELLHLHRPRPRVAGSQPSPLKPERCQRRAPHLMSQQSELRVDPPQQVRKVLAEVRQCRMIDLLPCGQPAKVHAAPQRRFKLPARPHPTKSETTPTVPAPLAASTTSSLDPPCQTPPRPQNSQFHCEKFDKPVREWSRGCYHSLTVAARNSCE